MQVFLFQSSLFAQVTSAHLAVLHLPNVKGRFRDPHFPADFFDLYSRLSLLKGKQDLCFTFTQKSVEPMWVLHTVELSSAGGAQGSVQ